MNIRVTGKRTKIPITSVMKPGITRKNPPIGVKIVFRKLSADGSNNYFENLNEIIDKFDIEVDYILTMPYSCLILRLLEFF